MPTKGTKQIRMGKVHRLIYALEIKVRNKIDFLNIMNQDPQHDPAASLLLAGEIDQLNSDIDFIKRWFGEDDL